MMELVEIIYKIYDSQQENFIKQNYNTHKKLIFFNSKRNQNDIQESNLRVKDIINMYDYDSSSSNSPTPVNH